MLTGSGRGETISPPPVGAPDDGWIGEKLWRPRALPLCVYALGLLPVQWLTGLEPAAYPFVYAAQCAVAMWVVWHHRKLLPELTLTVHWLAVPVGLIAAWAWVELGVWMAEAWPAAFGHEGHTAFEDMSGGVRWVSLSLRLAGMSLVVPIVEELFFRSLVLRSCTRARPTFGGVWRWFREVFLGGRPGEDDDSEETPFERSFRQTPLGRLTVFSVVFMALLWAVAAHFPRDWPGTIACGLLYCLILWATNTGRRRCGLGPVIWAHGVTNAALWVYTIYTNDWRFL